MTLSFLTAGESHGKGLVTVLDGIAAGFPVDAKKIDHDLARRQSGYGRGGRMLIEKDTAEILSGLRDGRTLGTPLAIRIQNRDHKIDGLPRVTRPRPGHADLSGALKYDRGDVRDVLERASARETTARVAVGSVCKQFLSLHGVEVVSHVVSIGGVRAPKRRWSFREIQKRSETNPVRCCDTAASRLMMSRIDFAKKNKDTLGGLFEVLVEGLSPALAVDKEFHARLAFGLMSIQAVKGVEIGQRRSVLGKRAAVIVLTGAMKPIATLMKPLKSVDVRSKKPVLATIERSDVTAVPACAVVAEAMAAFEAAKFYHETRNAQRS